MPEFRRLHAFARATIAAAAIAACDSDSPAPTTPEQSGSQPFEQGIPLDLVNPGELLPFTPLPQSAACVSGGTGQQLLLPTGYVPLLVASEGPTYPDLPDMMTVNETGSDRGRFLYRNHELTTNGAVTVTDLATGFTTILAQRADWERLDGIVWTPWGTLLTAEEVTTSAVKDPTQPAAQGGHVYEIDPLTGASTILPAIGSRSHEGLRFDKQGNLYGISETDPGYIFRFEPESKGDLSSGRLFALKIVDDLGDRTGRAEWVELDPAASLINSITEAGAKGATGYARPEDIEIGTSTGNDRRGNHTIYVAITGEDRVLAIDLAPPGPPAGQALVSDYVREGLNAPADFDFPDNLALDRVGNIYITEDPGGNAAEGKTAGDDVWFAPFNQTTAARSLPIERFLTLTDCDAEPTGVYLSPTGRSLFVNVQHRGGASPEDQTYAVQRIEDVKFKKTAK